MSGVHVCFVGTYKPGDPPPEGYMNWHAWAEVQYKSGLRQMTCPMCGLWYFPQEFSADVLTSTFQRATKAAAGETITEAKTICCRCATARPDPPAAPARSQP